MEPTNTNNEFFSKLFEASTEKLEKCTEELTKLRELTDNTEAFRKRDVDPKKDFDNIFGDQFLGFDNGQQIDVQYYTGDNNTEPRKLTIEENGQKTQKDILARMWVTDMKKQPPAALCYELTLDGNWYLEASDTVRKGAQDNVQESGRNIWTMRETKAVNKEEIELNIFDRLAKATKTKAS